ncbi:conjugative transfer protein MobI(A/C) [Vibrio sp. 10N]|uniref:conjugative transfer protein MobI(A/C) n=1 Tax=Vibrio sp. 10N TaxID=3058938 RepID=UPI0028144974|nr:hypothetical protein VB10N_47080 [Vibrio sp. 10N]
MQNILDAIYDEIDREYYRANEVYQNWMTVIAKREVERSQRKLDKSEKTNYELRLEFAGNSFALRWLKVTFTRHHTSKKLTKLYENISVPEDGRYKKGKFQKADEWELKMVMYAEEALSPIRVKVKHLMKAHQNVIYAAKSMNTDVQIKPQASRVEKTDLTIAKIKQRFK